MSDFAFAGKVFDIRVDNGVVLRNAYAPEGNKLRYEQIDGASEGGSGVVDLHVGEVAPSVYLLGWNEVSGAAVTHVMDFNSGTITGFWSFDADGGRTGEVHSATFTEVKLAVAGSPCCDPATPPRHTIASPYRKASLKPAAFAGSSSPTRTSRRPSAR
ncbi:hypothetical protein [Glycomyces sp. NRRL B-16210]|uniref:MoaF-related domain-containing protein n=1 Tax=Glycomyces sp. NRRL B-16210 TaxID=1463821 RepID=UPI0004BEC05F|nr:hypothetical protein [Glycomyces sp. NRRL B-16210]